MLGYLAPPQAESYVFINCHMGEKRVVLEHHGKVPVLGFHLVHMRAVHIKVAGADLLQPRYHAQHRGFAAAGGAHKHYKFLVGHIKTEIRDGVDLIVIDFIYIFKRQFRHLRLILSCVGIGFGYRICLSDQQI